MGSNELIVASNDVLLHQLVHLVTCRVRAQTVGCSTCAGMIASQLELHRLATNRQPRVATSLTMLKRYLYQYQGYVSAALVLGGVDCTGPSLYTVYPHGSTDKLPFVTMGSGSLAAMSMFEKDYKDGMDEEEAVKLVVSGISAGIFNDLGSGSNVDVCVIKKDSVDYRRNYVKPNERLYQRKRGYNFPAGSTAVLRESVTKIAGVVVEDGDQMDETA